MAQIFPLDIEVPVAALLSNAVRLPMYEYCSIVQVSGHLRVLTLGTFEVEVYDQSDNLIATLTWTAAGIQKVILESPLPTLPSDGHIRCSVTSLGVGAAGCQVTIWGHIA